MTESADLTFGRAELSDQGKLGPLLLSVYGPSLEKVREASERAALPFSSVEDELMAADDFYFSAIDLMDCCWLAHAGDNLIGAACVNPYVAELQFVAVLPEWRRKGVGGKLVELALAELSRRGIDHVRCELALALSDGGGKTFLERLGLHQVTTTVVMAKKL